MLDLAIIGAGPAALSAAIYAARAGKKVKVFSREEIGGALVEISWISNYPGFSGEGKVLAEKMRQQAEEAGAEISYGECTKIEKQGDEFWFEIDGQKVVARYGLIATGSEARTLDFELKVPVSYCALCDGTLVKEKKVAVVGGANSAVQEALYLAELAKEVTIVSHSKLKADEFLVKKVAEKNIEVKENLEPTAEFLNEFDHVFVYIGKQPAVGFLEGMNDKGKLFDDKGYIKVAGRTAHETVIKGLFVAGDVRSGAIRQIVTAAADGAAAVVEMGNLE